jgi:AcrR family transcriptional regulator
MARDAEDTKRKIAEAGLAEFAEHGLHGTTIERVAARAGVNKQRIYAYYGDKAALFAALVQEQVDAVAAAVPLVVTSAQDVGAFAGASFDYQVAHPDLARLLVWEGMAGTGTDAAAAAAAEQEQARTSLYRAKTAAVAAAQRSGVIDDTIAADHLVFMVLALASWWAVNPQVARMLTGSNDDGVARRRASVVEAATRLAAPRAVTAVGRADA